MALSREISRMNATMKFSLTTLLLVAAAVSLASANSWPRDKANQRNKLQHKVVCYWGVWAYYRSGADGKFEAEEINPNLCTHINYGFSKLVGNSIALYDPDLDGGDEEWSSGLTWGHGMIRRMNELRKYNPNLATMMSIGGWNEGSNKYSAMASTAGGRSAFVASVIEFLKKYELDGLDIDWEYPSMAAAGDSDRKPGRDADKGDYVELLKELHAAFEPYGFILTAAVSAGKPTIDRAYDVPAISKYLDFINVMAYDYHGGWDVTAQHNAPLYPLPGTTGIMHDFTVSFTIDYWLKLGAPSEKLVLGLGMYGRSFTLAGADTNIGAPVVGKGGTAGPITKLVGMLGYNEICSMVKGGWTEHWNDTQKVPYASAASQWVGYDNEKSLGFKLDLLLSKKFGGAMIWSIDTDDFSGHCGKGKYPLLKTITKKLNPSVDTKDITVPRTHATTPHTGGKTDAPVTQDPGHHETDAPVTHPDGHHTDAPNPGGKFHCTAAGFFKDPSNPSKFHQCVDFGGKLKDYEFNCPGGSTFDENLHICK